MKVLWTSLLISIAVCAHSQTVSPPSDPPQPHVSISDFGLVYPLSNDWVRATEMLRTRVGSANSAPNFDVLLAAVYVPKTSLSGENPFFSLFAYRQPATDCKKNLESMIAQPHGKKDKPEGSVTEFSAAGRDYFRLNLARGLGGRHQCIVCTVARGHLLVWEAGASNDKGLDTIVTTLDSITPSPQPNVTGSTQSAEAKDGTAAGSPSKADAGLPERVKVSSGVTRGLLIKEVDPIYPAGARAAYIQGTVLLKAAISKSGDIVDLELVSGPIELAGSAVTAVRQWKFKPYLLLGHPVAVATQIQVNYQLGR